MTDRYKFSLYAVKVLAEIPVTDKMFTLQKLLEGVSDTGLALVDKSYSLNMSTTSSSEEYESS